MFCHDVVLPFYSILKYLHSQYVGVKLQSEFRKDMSNSINNYFILFSFEGETIINPPNFYNIKLHLNILHIPPPPPFYREAYSSTGSSANECD